MFWTKQLIQRFSVKVDSSVEALVTLFYYWVMKRTLYWSQTYVSMTEMSNFTSFMRVVKKIKPTWLSISIEHCIVSNKWRKSNENVQGASLLFKRTNNFK